VSDIDLEICYRNINGSLCWRFSYIGVDTIKLANNMGKLLF